MWSEIDRINTEGSLEGRGGKEQQQVHLWKWEPLDLVGYKRQRGSIWARRREKERGERERGGEGVGREGGKWGDSSKGHRLPGASHLQCVGYFGF